MNKRWIVAAFKYVLGLGAFLALAGGAAIALVAGLNPEWYWLRQALYAYGFTMAGFFLFGILGLMVAATEALLRKRGPSVVILPQARPPQPTGDPSSLHREVLAAMEKRDWDGARRSAVALVDQHPDSTEAAEIARLFPEIGLSTRFRA